MSEKLLDRSIESMEAYLGSGAPYKGLVMAVSTLILLIYFHRIGRNRLVIYLDQHAYKAENAQQFLRIYGFVMKAFIGIAVLSAATGSFRVLGLSVALIGSVLGWSLQTPIRGVAAWLMVVLKRPFGIGDRISVDGIVGDVTDIQLNHIILNQVGGTVQGEEKSGRTILVPTAMLFGENVLNYNYFAEEGTIEAPASTTTMLDEVLVRITFGSDLEEAKRLCVEAATQALSEIVAPPGEAPFIRMEFLAWGVLLRVRYKTVPAKRPEISSRVTEIIWAALRQKGTRVEFCFPVNTTSVRLPSDGYPPPMAARSPVT